MGGFYIECGAADGEENSNTLFFEMKRNWKGNQTSPLSLDVFLLLLPYWPCRVKMAVHMDTFPEKYSLN